MMPKAGGQYVFLREGLSPLAGFLFGWTLFTVIQTGTIAAVAVAFAKFLGVLVPACHAGRLPLAGPPPDAGRDDRARALLPAARRARRGAGAHLDQRARRDARRRGSRPSSPWPRCGRFAVLIVLRPRHDPPARRLARQLHRFWGTGDWSLALLPVVGAAMVGRSSRATPGTTSPSPRPRCGIRSGTCRWRSASAPRSSRVLYLLANVAYLNLLPFAGDPTGADAFGPRHPARRAGPGGHGRGRGDARADGRRPSWRWPSCSRPSAASTGSSSRARGSTTPWRATACSSSARARCTRPTRPRPSAW